ncbi:MAG TPA: hypothetical protein VFX24_02930 [Ktedonobacterales bacterium]|nr:hypothetical protein [Ktedonobacterales bacterium]
MPGSDSPYDDQITPLPVWHPMVGVATPGVLARLALFCCGMIPLVALLSGCGGTYACTTCQTHPSLASVSMVSADEGWAVGIQAGGGILVHYQGGQWSPVPITGGAAQLSSIDMLSASEGWSVGQQGTILHYRDGLWSKDTSPTSGDLRSVSMVSPTEGWAVGPGVMLHYTNGGWTRVQPIPSLVSVTMDSASDGWAVGNEAIAHYHNGAWTTVTPSFPLTGIMLISVVMASPSEGWAIGNTDHTTYVGGPPVILHYHDGQWQLAANPLTGEDTLTAIALASPEEGWAMGVDGESSVILHYTRQNGWVRVTTPLKIAFHGVSMVSPTEGWAVGDGNNFVQYENGAWC